MYVCEYDYIYLRKKIIPKGYCKKRAMNKRVLKSDSEFVVEPESISYLDIEKIFVFHSSISFLQFVIL